VGINAIIKERHLLTHPFYQKWQQGKVSLSTLQDYACQYYHYERALPGFLTSALEHLEEGDAKQAVAEVLSDECSKPKAHTELWLDFAEGLGVDPADVTGSTPSTETTNLVETYSSLTRHGADEALGALYAYESQVPGVALAKAEGLRSLYGITDPATLKFFDLHSTLDIVHAKALKSALRDSEFSRESIHLALDAWWGMLDQFL
jgi:pyrroloquinoline-quinone synthase